MLAKISVDERCRNGPQAGNVAEEEMMRGVRGRYLFIQALFLKSQGAGVVVKFQRTEKWAAGFTIYEPLAAPAQLDQVSVAACAALEPLEQVEDGGGASAVHLNGLGIFESLSSGLVI
jgi:hypothetical protein